MIERFSLVLSLMLSILLAFLIVLVAGEDPLLVFQILLSGAFGSPTDFGYTLYYSTPLIFTGLSVAWALRAGLFNIGAEGQMVLAGVALAAIGAHPLPWYLAVPIAIIVVVSVGGIWAGVAGWLKAKRGLHEVLSTILLNFIAYGIAGFFISIVLRNPEVQVPETTPIAPSYWIPEIHFLGGLSPFNYCFGIGILTALIYGVIDSRSQFGFQQRLVGEACGLARQTGTRVQSHILWAMVISGMFAGLASLNEILGYLHKTREGFSAGVGFVGIAVALLGRGKWYGILLASLFFGAIHKGSLNLDIDTQHISRDFSLILQGLTVLLVASDAGIQFFLKRYFRGNKNV